MNVYNDTIAAVERLEAENWERDNERKEYDGFS